MQYHNILRDYLRDYAIPAMLEQGWAFKPAKLYGWQYAQRGPEYHVDQPLRTHIINGLYALTRALEYLKNKEYYHISETEFKRTLVLYTMHDAYKDFEIASSRMGRSDFSIPLVELDKLLERQRRAPLPTLYGQKPGEIEVGQRLKAGVSEVIDGGKAVIVLFSVLNPSSHAIELMPPQVQLGGKIKKKWTI